MKTELEKAVRLQRLYIGSVCAPISYQLRLYRQLTRANERVARISGLSLTTVSLQVEREATRRGAITPQPGKDY